jgi:hypothetical protein
MLVRSARIWTSLQVWGYTDVSLNFIIIETLRWFLIVPPPLKSPELSVLGLGDVIMRLPIFNNDSISLPSRVHSFWPTFLILKK